MNENIRGKEKESQKATTAGHPGLGRLDAADKQLIYGEEIEYFLVTSFRKVLILKIYICIYVLGGCIRIYIY